MSRATDLLKLCIKANIAESIIAELREVIAELQREIAELKRNQRT